MRDFKLRKRVTNSYVSTSALSTQLSGYVTKGTTAIPDLAADANAATIVTKVNALLAALRANGCIKTS